jgi:hypothetical protein
MRSNRLYRASLTLIALLSLAETAAAQAVKARSDPVDKGEVKIVVTVWAAPDTPSNELYRAILASISQLSLAESTTAQAGQTKSDPVDNGEVKIEVTVSAAADKTAEQQLSQDFTAAALRATTLLGDWQRSIAYTIRLGLLPCESCIAMDRDQAADAVRLATLLASKDADQTALQELLNLSENVEHWSDALVEDKRNGELGQYYTSATALNDDPLFQKAAACAGFLAPMLASGRLAEDPSCQ